MSSMDESRNESEPATGRLDEKMLSALVGGVFWFTWLTVKYRRAASMAAQVEGQRPALN